MTNLYLALKWEWGSGNLDWRHKCISNKAPKTEGCARHCPYAMGLVIWFFSILYIYFLVEMSISFELVKRLSLKRIIAPKASAEGACIWREVGYYGACVMGYYDCAWRVTNMRVWMGYFGIWVILACANFIRGCPVFWRWLVTVENDDVLTNLL